MTISLFPVTADFAAEVGEVDLARPLADADLQAMAKAWGVKVPIWVRDITLVPVFFRFEHAWFVLEGDGRREITALEAVDRMEDVYGDEYFEWKAIADDTDRARLLFTRGAR